MNLNPKPERIKRPISGVLLLDKPPGITSNQALQIAKRIFAARKAGHTGTLDPMATGMLPICFGEATKFASALLGADKTYETTLRLGYISTTGDADGELSVASDIKPHELVFSRPQAEAALKSFIGRIMQVPPMYSALKHHGKPMYTYARKGVEIERQSREVIIHDISIEALQGNELSIRVKCGTGTYIRTLAEDIGKALGCGGAYLTFLRRSVLDCFDLSQAYTLDALETMQMQERDHCLLPADILMRNFPAATLKPSAAMSLQQGRTIADYVSEDRLGEGQRIRLYDQANRFLGLGEMMAGGEIAPRRLIAE